MADTIIGNGGTFSSLGSFTYVIDYDSTAKVVGIACAGVGHAKLVLTDTGNNLVVGSVYCDQYGITDGPIAQSGSVDAQGQPNAGESASAVTYDNTRYIIAGPGATGMQTDGSLLPTSAVQGNIVNRLNPAKHQQASLAIGMDWHP